VMEMGWDGSFGGRGVTGFIDGYRCGGVTDGLRDRMKFLSSTHSYLLATRPISTS
jgi:hypothetical protein